MYRNESLVFRNWLDIFHVAAEACELGRYEKALPGMGPGWVIDVVVGKIRHDLAGDDSVEGGRAGNTAELQRLKIIRRRLAISGNRRVVKVVGYAYTFEGALDRIGKRRRKSSAGLGEVLQ